MTHVLPVGILRSGGETMRSILLAVAVAAALVACDEDMGAATLAEPAACNGTVVEGFRGTIEPCPDGTVARGDAWPVGLHSWCETCTGLPHGIEFEWYGDGSARSMYTWDRGALTGPHSVWEANGDEEHGHYVDGRRCGLLTTCRSSGGCDAREYAECYIQTGTQ